MKQILRIVILLMLAAFLTASLLYAHSSTKTIKTKWETISGPQKITVKWDRKWGVLHYDIYSKDVTGKIYTSDNVPLKEYHKIGSVSGLHGSFVDKNVKNGHYYAYVIRGYNKDKLICDSFNRNVTQYECAGLAKPGLGNDGYGENNENSPKCLYLYVQIDGGMSPDGVEIYRKAESEKKYQLIKPGNTQAGESGEFFEVQDNTVKPGTTYTYKVRTFAAEGNDKIYSEDSETVTIPAVNFVGKFKINEMKTDPEAGEIRLTIKSDKYNGKLKLDKGAPSSLALRNKKGKAETYPLVLDKDMLISAGETTELIFTCTDKPLPEVKDMSGSLAVGVESEGVTYEMGVSGWTELKFDLDKKTGTVFVDYDS